MTMPRYTSNAETPWTTKPFVPCVPVSPKEVPSLRDELAGPGLRIGVKNVADMDRDWAFASLLKPMQHHWDNGVAIFPFERRSSGLVANQTYFDHPEWCSRYLRYVHRSPTFRARWARATGPWSGKVVIDVGCGPGNVAACLEQEAKLLVGVDISRGALQSAAQFGYTPVHADAQDLPFQSHCADIVIANAVLHHCDDMAKTLSEAARLVRLNGVLVTDHDPQLSAYKFKGMGLALWKWRLAPYRLMKVGFHRSLAEQTIALASEIHHNPGDGVTPQFFESVLVPLGFEVRLYPHNHDLGEEVFSGKWGRSVKKVRIAQMLSGLDPDSRTSALSIMCVATRVRCESRPPLSGATGSSILRSCPAA
jgi:ubiquinone/menaquinone biosynthesis C-methylase UbiE